MDKADLYMFLAPSWKMTGPWRISVVQSCVFQKWLKVGHGGSAHLQSQDLGKLRLEDHEFKASMGYIVLSQKQRNKTKTAKWP